MKTRTIENGGWPLAKLLPLFILLHSAVGLRALGQRYSIDAFTIAGGGGASSGATYQVGGVIGLPDAGRQPLSGGGFSLTGGSLNIMAVLETTGAPTLTLIRSGNNIIISWSSSPAGFVLQQASDLGATRWADFGGALNDDGVNKSVRIIPGSGNAFYRLLNMAP